LVGPLQAVENRNIPDFDDLTFNRGGGIVEIEFWMDIGDILSSQVGNLINYRVCLRKDERLGVCVHEEQLRQFSKSWLAAGKKFEFSDKVKPRSLLGKTSKSTDFYRREDGRYVDSFVFGMDKLTLSLTPPDQQRYPTANTVKRFLRDGIRYVQLNSRAMRLPCAATRPTELELDGSNLARVVGVLLGEGYLDRRRENEFSPKEALDRWTDHLRYALPDLKAIAWDRRQADNAEFIVLKYESGLECPSWLISDGTLRMLALTVLAFLPSSPGIYMVEEPENGVHPKALEIMLRSLATVPVSQVLIATHSPFVVQHAGRDALLCFSRDQEGTIITPGKDHPALKEMVSRGVSNT
ncbi:MAG: ATP-binding protein, partial [Deltaproteobacteria bacterium]|nr:ATP-binding protein [Deltaproteobacteria bacterium]